MLRSHSSSVVELGFEHRLPSSRLLVFPHSLNMPLKGRHPIIAVLPIGKLKPREFEFLAQDLIARVWI